MIHDSRVGELALPGGATVVVGSGAAGLALALALADAGETVIVLESGGDHGDAVAERAAAALNEAAQTGLPLDGVVNGRARTLGGSTALWHGQCMRLHPLDMEARPWVENSGWPMAPAELDAHYPAAERFLQVSGRGYGSERWRDHARLPPLDWNHEQLLHDFTEYTPRPHLGQVHRGRFASDPKLHLVLNATASRVVVEGNVESGVARGVEVRAVGRPAARIAARRVVLACGGIENARLLMLSDDAGIGLGSGRRHTGRYYQDHPIIRTAEVVSRDHRVLQDRYIALHARGRRLFAKVRLAPAAQRREGLLDATAVFVHDHDDPARAALRRLVVAARHGRRPERPLRDAVRGLAAPWPLLRDLYRRYARGLATGSTPSAVWLQLWVEQQPDAESRVELDSDATATDPLGLRCARLHWKCSDLELETSRAMTRWLGADLERLDIARLRFLPAMTDDAAWRGSVGDAAHPAGTTRMSLEESTGVVDRDCAVHGVGGLYVAGSSVFPICGYANPTLTLVALALRLAGHLTAVERSAPPSFASATRG